MSHSESKSAVLLSLGANAAVAVSKFGAAGWTGSGSMLAEAIHSSADCLNQIFLLVGMKRSDAPACKDHPLGHGKEIFFWSMLVAMLLFFVGGVYSIMEGTHRVLHPEPIEHAGIAVGILFFAVVLEWKSLAAALQALKSERGSDTLMQWVRKTKNTDLLIVTGENTAALAGLAIALVAIGASLITGNPVYDAIGSIAVGLLLVGVAFVLTKEIHSLLIGEHAGDEYDSTVRKVCAENGFNVLNIISIANGNKVMLAVKAVPVNTSGMSADDLINLVNQTEAAIKKVLPKTGWIFFEPDHVV
ncbi:MAG TPA: cation diffusion facilitator family transporter [Methanosarcina sp.]|nr:cation diffusion facilitator family transporter [Methanosarcina sp.]